MLSTLVLKVKRAESPPYALAKSAAKAALALELPLPGSVRPAVLALHRAGRAVEAAVSEARAVVYARPVCRSLCASAGARLRVARVPEVSGNVQMHLGDDVVLSGVLGVKGGRAVDAPELRIGNRVFIGHRVTFSIGRSVVVEDDVLIAQGCFIADNSGHPLDAEARAAGRPVDPDDVRPVRICRKAWVGRGAVILPGVTVGEGAIVGAGSVVTRDVPPFGVCVGNPGRVLDRRAG
ncbi:MAG TPA: acyltransferase [Polyangiaceae bacterium]|nr:acyltransferase [Polyangiaceae bacterium]